MRQVHRCECAKKSAAAIPACVWAARTVSFAVKECNDLHRQQSLQLCFIQTGVAQIAKEIAAAASDFQVVVIHLSFSLGVIDVPRNGSQNDNTIESAQLFFLQFTSIVPLRAQNSRR